MARSSPSLLLRLLALACAVASCGALQMAAVRPQTVARVRPLRALATEADEDKTVEIKTSELTEEERAEIAKAEAEDPLMQAAGGDSDFVRWYRYEKAKEQYLKENPVDVLANAGEKLKGPLSSLVIIVAGFYTIPLVRGIADGVREGDVFGSLSNMLANPTDSVKF